MKAPNYKDQSEATAAAAAAAAGAHGGGFAPTIVMQRESPFGRVP
jgi:hypothetical protein